MYVDETQNKKDTLTTVIKRYLALCCILLVSLYGVCQNEKDFESFKITSADGEGIGYLTDLVQDTSGKLWMSGGGWPLRSYDGITFESYHVEALKRLGPELARLENAVRLNLNTDKNLEFSYKNYVIEFNPYTHKIIDSITCKTDPELPQIFQMICEKDRKVTWNVFFRTDVGRFGWLTKSNDQNELEKIFKFDIGASPNLIEHNNKIILSGAQGQLHAVDKFTNEVRTYILIDDGKIATAHGMAVDKNNILWTRGTSSANNKKASNAVFYYDESLDSFVVEPTIRTDALGRHIFMNIVGQDMWLSGLQDDVVHINMESKEQNVYNNDFIEDYYKHFQVAQVKSIAEDIPYSIGPYGVAIFRPKKKYNYSVPFGKKCDGDCPVNSITKHGDLIYFSSNNELYSYDQKSDTVLKTPIALPNRQSNVGYRIEDLGANKLTSHNDNLIWNDNIIDPSTNSLTDILTYGGDYRCINFVDSDGRLWLAPYYETRVDSSVFIYDFESKECIALDIPDTVFKEEVPLQIIESKFDDKVFVVFQRRGILEFSKEGKYLRTIFPNTRLYVNRYYIHESEPGFLWIAHARGLRRYNLSNDTYESYSNGTTDVYGYSEPAELFAMVAVNDSMLWVASMIDGIECFNLNTKKFVSPDFPNFILSTNFDRGGGLYDDETKKLFLGSETGLRVFAPEEYLVDNSESSPFPILVTEFASYSKGDSAIAYQYSSLNVLDEITLPHNHFWISLKYVLPYYQLNDKIFYSHKLEGYDEDFTFNKHDNDLKYTAIPPGEYNLILRAGLRENSLNDYRKTIKVIVKEAWYKIWWMKIIWLLLFASLIYFALRYKFRQEIKKREAIEALRTKISMDLHDDVGSLLSGLAMQVELLGLKIGDAHKDRMEKISTISRTAMMQLRDTVWAMDNRKNNWLALVDRINEFGHMSFQDRNIAFEFNQTVDQRGAIDPIMRQNIYLILKEALTNIVKHSDASEVKVNLDSTDSNITLVVADNGSVVDAQGRAGSGLTNMITRAKQINAKLNVEKKEGYRIQLMIPIL